MSETGLKDRRDQRRDAILEVARSVFTEDGFAAASMSCIAARLGGSKGTLYNYFKSKEELFAAYVSDECGRFADAMFAADENIDLVSHLTGIGERFLSHLLSERAVRTYQLVVAEAHRTPELARIFYEAGPAVGLERLTRLLEEARVNGEIEADDCEVAALQFMALCRGNLHFRYSLNLIGRPSEAEIKASIEEAVRTFIARYGRQAPAAQAGPPR
jgi:AcrR family transcriptional regulator